MKSHESVRSPHPLKDNKSLTKMVMLYFVCPEKFNFFSFLPTPPHKKLVREKLPDYILGFAISSQLKWRWDSSSTSGDPETLTPASSDFSLEF